MKTDQGYVITVTVAPDQRPTQVSSLEAPAPAALNSLPVVPAMQTRSP